MNRRQFLTVGGMVTGAMLSIAGCMGNDQQNAENQQNKPKMTTQPEATGTSNSATGTPTQSSATPKATVETTELHSKETSYSTEYTGYAEVKNVGNVQIRRPTATVKFLDSDDAVLESTDDFIYFLDPGQVWEVRSPFTGSDATPAKFTVTIKTAEMTASPQPYSHPSELKLSDVTVEKGDSVSVVGNVTNTTQRTIDVFAFSQFNTKKGHILGAGLDSISSLSPNQSWKFNAEWLFTDKELIPKVADHDLWFTVQ